MNISTETFGPIRRALAVGGLALTGTLALTGCGILDQASSTDSASEVSEEQFDAVADAAAGDCLPEEMLGGDNSTFAVDCEDPTAFWTITAIEADPAVTANASGTVDDPAGVYELCGETVAAQIPGSPWTDWNMIYDPTTLTVDYLFCVEAIGVPTAAGTTPVVPAAGECYNSMSVSSELHFGTLPCDSADVDSVVVDAIAVDQADWATADAEAIAAECSGEWVYYQPVMDQFGRTTAVYCTE
ncbi:hypothetical protein K3N28_11160 [Glycomyces sp. TRM65418]|uniref:hypothetical protein n=1 Tax=Glycomyces sp. TRM65418 TaxID=2867006 RepID=UPI001CE52567|nr:hypothetical protein [Glycomyces sp. TRM65418]MCC3763629.1 hypothetical protein [Glycomyces sp. TRM65418]QZD57612.1 hypothetical protein K3N28_11100 [Glycomyces sp. TRM65418]